MSDIKIDKSGASRSDQRELQKLILKINPDALPKYGADGDVGSESIAALQEILGTSASDSMTVEEATEALQDIVNAKALEDDADKLITDDDVSKENAQRVQEMIQKIVPGSLPKYGADGDIGGETLDALKEILPNVDLEQVTMSDIVAKLEDKIEQLPERYIVEDCDTLSEVALEVYGDDIKELTQQLLDAGKFEHRGEAEQYAIQMAYTKLAFANGKEQGTDANDVFPGEVLEIPEPGPLSEVIADPEMRLDVEALDADRNEGGPCGCDGESPMGPSPKSMTPEFTPAVNPPVSQPDLPSEVELSPDCKAVLHGTSRGFLALGEERPRYSIVGENLNGEFHILNDKLREMGFDVKVRSNGSCDFPHEGGGEGPPSVSNDSDGGGQLGGGPAGPPGGSVGLNQVTLESFKTSQDISAMFLFKLLLRIFRRGHRG